MIAINLRPTLQLTDAEFEQICRSNPDLRMERTATGELVAMPPTGSETGHYNVELSTELTLWNRRSKLGITFDSSAGFTLPNGAIRSPDASWIRKDRWETLLPEQQRRFAPICPDFVVELKSPSDLLDDLQDKMLEYLENGAQLGWLIQPETRTVETYRPGQAIETLENPTRLPGEGVLPGFTLDLQIVWGS